MSPTSPHQLFRIFALMFLAMVLVSGCATQHTSKESLIWSARGQFVTVIDREGKPGERAEENQHPVSLSSSELRAELAALKIKLPGDHKPTPLFGEGELAILSEQIPAGLRQAGPDQDLGFAIIGEISFLKGLVVKEVVTTGRVFYRDSRLNLILGLSCEPIRKEDPRLQPFTPGSRLRAAQLSGPVTTTSSTAVFQANRPDWITMAIPKVEAEQPVPEAEIHSETKGKAPASAISTNGAAKPDKSIEERLRMLGELKAKGLITEKEYRTKKESILNEL